ncbi:hypothetical protein MMC07_004954 [Pseudocyphellaria aurata]|nr:hypothetical protein [Pseudocyphellaria aurata]
MASSDNDLTLPDSQPPPGVVAHLVFTAKPTKAAIILVAVCVATATTFVWARIYTKIRLKSHSWEDYTSFIAWWTNRTEIVYVPTIMMTKVSILLMYLRLFEPNRQTNFFTRFMIWTNVLFYLSILIAAIAGCIPRRKIWRPWEPGKCVDEVAILLVTAVFNTLSDLAILLLPIRCVWHLQLSPRQKLAISAVFAAGSVACVASVVRISIAIKRYSLKDFTYSIGSQTAWAYVPVLPWLASPNCLHTSIFSIPGLPFNPFRYGEVSVGILCGCMPVAPQFFRHLVPEFTQRFSHHRSKVQNYLGRFVHSSRTPSCAAQAGDSEVLPAQKRGKGFLTLGSSGKNLMTIIRNVLPSALPLAFPLTSLPHRKKRTSDGSMDLERQRGITTIKDDSSISTQTELEDMDITDRREREAP